MGLNKIISILLTIGTIFLIILVFLVIMGNTQEQFLFECYKQNWEGIIEFHGEISGTIDCDKQRINLFENNNWVDICSSFPFSYKPSCHTLCNWDCEIYNKLNKENRCIC